MSEAMNLDWGYSANAHMNAARKLVANGVDLNEMINAKMKAYNTAFNGDAKAFRARQDMLDEIRALIGASMEAALPQIEEASITSMLLDVAIKAEQLRATDAVHDAFVHQLKLEVLCDSLVGVVCFLLAKQLPKPPGEA